METNNLIIERQSTYDMETTVGKIVEAAITKGWQNPATHNLQESLAKAGTTVMPVKVVELCKPDFSGRLLSKNHERIVSVMMPCRVSVYVKDDGNTWVAAINVGVLTAGMDEAVSSPMNDAAAEIADIINSVCK